jgi:hypothetical protein
MSAGLVIRNLQAADVELIAGAFARLGWNKPAAQYRRYLTEQEEDGGSSWWPSSAAALPAM